MASIRIPVSTPVTIALNKDPDDLTAEDKQLLREYNKAMDAKQAEWNTRLKEQELNYQDAIISGLNNFIKQTDKNIVFIKNQTNQKKYLKAINDYISILEHNKEKDFLYEYYKTIDAKIRELKLLYASIDI